MADIAQGNRAELILNPGDVYRVSTGGSATVEAVYGAPAGTTTVTASTQDFGPYAANAKLIVRAVSGPASYSINQAVPIVARNGSLDDASRAVLRLSQAGCVQTFRTHGQAGASVGAAYTFAIAAMLEGEYDAVRFCFANYGTNTWTISGAKTAASPSVANNGTGLTWANVTFDKAASAQQGDIWDGTTGAATTYVMPAAVADAAANSVPSLVWSDWVPQSSVACTDSGSTDLRVTQMRMYSASTGYKVMQAGASVTNYGDYNTNSRRKYYGALTAGDQVTTITSLTPLANWQWSACVAVQGLLRKPVYNHGIFGDSISKGQGSYDNNNGLWGWAHRVPQGLTDSGIGTHSVANYAVSGQGKAATWSTFLRVIQQRGLDTATMFPWSPNDGEANINAFRFQVWAFISECQKYGVKPILCTQPPAAQITTTGNDALRKAINSEIRAMSSQATVCDFDAVLSDNATLARFASGLSNGDNVHPSSAGHAAMDAVYRAAVRQALQI